MFSICNGWLFWFVNHTSMAWTYQLNVFKKLKVVGEISSDYPNDLFETFVYKTLESILWIIIVDDVTLS